MELKWSGDWKSCSAPKSSNCTFMELKLNDNVINTWGAISSNCTFMELKYFINNLTIRIEKF